MGGIVTNLLTWGAKELISGVVGGGSSGSSAGQAIAAQGKKTQE